MMPILRHKINQEFTILPNCTLKDRRLSLRDVGLLAYMLHLPDGWEFSISGLDAVLPHDGRDAIAASLQRIEKASYLRRERERNANGQIGGVVWYVSDLPMTETPETDLPNTVKPDTGSPNTANPLQRKYLLDKEPINKESKEDAPPVVPFQGELAEAFNDWITYKRERRQGYKPTGLKSLMTQTRKAAEQYGDHAVAEIIRTSMANGYQGILFDRLNRWSGGGEAHGNASYSSTDAAGNRGSNPKFNVAGRKLD